MNLETRYTSDIQIRSNDTGDSVILEGYAAKYNNRSKLLAEDNKIFYEIIRKGAFIEGLAASRDVIMVLDHDPKKLLGRTKSGTLELTNDDIGLRFELELPNTTMGKDTLEMVKRGDISELSFAFYLRNIDYTWKKADDGTLLREITNFKSLKDVSLLQTNAAYDNTNVSITAREYDEIERKLNDDFEEYYNTLKEEFYNFS